jgi:HK97 family phage portal protein
MGRNNFMSRVTIRANSISQALGLRSKAAPFVWPVNHAGATRWQMGDFRTYASEGFNINAIIYSAIMYKVRAVTQASPLAYKGKEDQPERLPITHPLSRLLVRPNPHMSWVEMQGLLTVFLNLSGNAYVYIDREKQKQGIPGALWPIRPDEIYLIPDQNTIKGYLYVPRTGSIKDGVPILLEDMIHVKFPNPLDPYNGLGYGMSPMAAIAQTGDIDNAVTKFLKVFFDRGAQPVGMLKFAQPLDQIQVDQIKERWRKVYGGVDNWADVGVLDSGADYKQMSYNFNEMGFDILDNRNESRIIGPFGVPPILLGTRFGLENATYSNYETARKAFWEDTMTYELRLFEDEFVPLVGAAKQLWDMGTPAAIAFPTVGLNIPEFDGHDISWVPTSVRDSREPSQPSAPKRAGINKDDDDDPHRGVKFERLLRQIKRQSQGDQLRGIMESWDARYEKAAAKSIKNDLAELLTITRETAKKSMARKATIDWTPITGAFDDYLGHAGEEAWRETFVPLIAGTVRDAGDMWATQLGTSFNLRNIEAEEWFRKYTLEFAQPINATTSEMVHDMVAQALEEGWSNETLQNNFSTVFRTWAGDGSVEDTDWLAARSPVNRAEMIARTETTRAANAGSQQLFKRYGAEAKEWSTSLDGRERASHGAADGQRVAIDHDFTVGGFKMAHPGDMTGGASVSEIVNCRCAILPIVADTPPVTESAKFEPRTFADDDAFWAFHDDPTWKAKWDSMSSEERNGFEEYTGFSYTDINSMMRGNSNTGGRRAEDAIAGMRKYFADPKNVTHEDMILYRGSNRVAFGLPQRQSFNPRENITGDQLQPFVGTYIRDPAFLSTTLDRSVAANFASNEDNIVFELEAPRGTKGLFVAPNSRHREEHEVTLDSNTMIEIISIDQVTTGRNGRYEIIVKGRIVVTPP